MCGFFQTLCIGNFLPAYQGVIKLAQIVKEIKGHSYPISSALSVNSAVNLTMSR